MNWSEYQNKAAEFFSSLGLDTKIEHKIEGVWGTHEVDVYVSGCLSGITFSWVIECKAWKSNIPKEKVMALSAIVQDVGADKGILLSEIGFQSGAIKAARTSNIILTSIEDLSFSARNTLIENKNLEVQKAKKRLFDMRAKSEEHKYNDERLMISSELGVLDSMFEDALVGDYPILYPVKNMTFLTVKELLKYADEVIEYANNCALK